MLSVARAASLFALAIFSDIHADNLRVATWGGAYGHIYEARVLEPFSLLEKTLVERVDTESGGEIGPDIVELSLHEAIRGCADGDLMLLPPASIAAFNDLPAYLPNSVQPCSIGQWAWATVAAYSQNIVKSGQSKPALISDFFNTTDFPGKRAIRKSPRVLAEWALAAAGVSYHEIYQALDLGDEVWPMIEQQLRLIENDVVWVDSDADALRYIRDGSAAFAAVSTNSAVKEAMVSSSPPDVLWDASIMELSMLGVPATSAQPELALELLRYVSDSQNLLEFSAALGFSPINSVTGRLLNSAYRKYLPIESSNYENSIWGNTDWWQTSTSSEEIVSKFTQWFEKVQSMHSLVMVTSDRVMDSAAVPVRTASVKSPHRLLGVNF